MILGHPIAIGCILKYNQSERGGHVKILYRQINSSPGALDCLGVTDCYFKLLSLSKDHNSISKTHHHTGFELHMITQGTQCYEISGTRYQLEAGQLLLIPPELRHRLVFSEAATEKAAITFRLPAFPAVECLYAPISAEIRDAIRFICAEAALSKKFSRHLIENRILEVIVTVLREAGMVEETALEASVEHTALALSRQYIADNIENAPTVAEVAQYCYISTKQLVRIFQKELELSPGEYILRKKTEHIEKLLTESSLSLGQISEQMHFSSEYYFSTFFKKNAGMPPGEYRKMYGK